MAPQVGLEPTTTRLTAECSAIELLRIIGIRQRPTLPGRFQPSTISAKRLNFCVRDGNRWIPLAITTGNFSGSFACGASDVNPHRRLLYAFASAFALHSHVSIRFAFHASASALRFRFHARFAFHESRLLRTFAFALRFCFGVCSRFGYDAEPTTDSRACACGLHAPFRLHGLRFRDPPPRFRTLTSAASHSASHSASLPLACPDNCTAQVDLGTPLQSFALLLRLSPRPISISNLHRLRGFQR